ncbi:hypothetical protein D3D03_16420 [Exiguobacterium sp. RIT452]|uniref:hypothetical protein n=1 Tax=Exiguobacterium sp. RIT452 TaxID=2315552 RepID=UPI000E720944|nr:hypothetical protein [Exiguobacterium sp. RIT452]RJO94701.1 hypothetical protein D3D03_16420 [Exiguobacterium sp. RIT452]
MSLFDFLLLTVSVLLGLVASLFIGSSIYYADEEGDQERVQELFTMSKVGFVIAVSSIFAIRVVVHLIT